MGDDAEWAGNQDIFSDPEERAHVYSVLDSFRQYRRAAHFNTTHVRRQSFYALPSQQWALLSRPPISYLDTLSNVDDAIDNNADIADAILKASLASLGLSEDDTHPSTSSRKPEWHGTATKLNLDKTRSTINQLFRDWSAEAEPERNACYGTILEGLSDVFLPAKVEAGVKVLVPGAGLGRLVFELYRAGYHAEGNEISWHQLLTSSFILNHTTKANEWRLHPWVMSFSNHLNREHQLQKVMIPDVWPGSLQSTGSMKMTTGDFCELYQTAQRKDEFDAVVTTFFIDTAPNLISYIETVRHCLKPGGLWINLGPLLWHFEEKISNNDVEEEEFGTRNRSGNGKVMSHVDNVQKYKQTRDTGSFELSEDEVIDLVQSFGFILGDTELGEITGYIHNRRSMLQSVYRSSYWMARKV